MCAGLRVGFCAAALLPYRQPGGTAANCALWFSVRGQLVGSLSGLSVLVVTVQKVCPVYLSAVYTALMLCHLLCTLQHVHKGSTNPGCTPCISSLSQMFRFGPLFKGSY